jgi:drug/metabolite transporter (DMT)-like permease
MRLLAVMSDVRGDRLLFRNRFFGQMARHARAGGEVVWARYVGAAIFSVMVARPWARPRIFRANRPWLQIFRSLLLLGSTYANFLALRQLQLAETSTIAFLSPLLVALMAGPWLGERVGGARMAAIAVGFLGVVIATRPGTSAFQPIVFVAISGVFCNAAYGLATRMLAGRDSAETTLVWTPLAGVDRDDAAAALLLGDA